jgi:hypothetical protein
MRTSDEFRPDERTHYFLVLKWHDSKDGGEENEQTQGTRNKGRTGGEDQGTGKTDFQRL